MGKALEKFAASRNVKENRARINEKIKKGTFSGTETAADFIHKKQKRANASSAIKSLTDKKDFESKRMALRSMSRRNKKAKVQNPNAREIDEIVNKRTRRNNGLTTELQSDRARASKRAYTRILGESPSSDRKKLAEQTKKVLKTKGGRAIVNSAKDTVGHMDSPMRKAHYSKPHAIDRTGSRIHSVVNAHSNKSFSPYTIDMRKELKAKKAKKIENAKARKKFITNIESSNEPAKVTKSTPIDKYIRDNRPTPTPTPKPKPTSTPKPTPVPATPTSSKVGIGSRALSALKNHKGKIGLGALALSGLGGAAYIAGNKKKSLKKTSGQINKKQLMSAGGTPSVNPNTFKNMTPAQKLSYNQKNGRAIAMMMASRNQR